MTIESKKNLIQARINLLEQKGGNDKIVQKLRRKLRNL